MTDPLGGDLPGETFLTNRPGGTRNSKRKALKMNNATKPNAISLERDPRYVAAQSKLTELKTQLDALDRQRSEELARLNGFDREDRPSDIEIEARLLVSNETTAAPTSSKDNLRKSITEMAHRMAVLRMAIDMQRKVIEQLRSEIGNQIALELLPQHVANVRSVIDALLVLNDALEAENALREECQHNDIPVSGFIRPMPFPGCGRLSQDNSRLFLYLADAAEHGFIERRDLPESVQKHLPAPAKLVKKSAPVRIDADGWLPA
jgi:hypothetical protein